MFAVQSTNQDAASGQHLSQAGTLRAETFDLNIFDIFDIFYGMI